MLAALTLLTVYVGVAHESSVPACPAAHKALMPVLSSRLAWVWRHGLLLALLAAQLLVFGQCLAWLLLHCLLPLWLPAQVTWLPEAI